MAHLAFLITEDWYFRQHFLALAVAARQTGYQVSVLCRTGERGSAAADAITAAGITLHEIGFDRSGLNPLRDLATRRQITRTYHAIQPDIVHHIALKPIIHGQAAARRAGVAARVNFIPGFGHVFTASSMKARLLRPLVATALRRALAGETGGLMAMNGDDQVQLADLAGTDPTAVTVLPGTGVDLARFPLRPEPARVGPGEPIVVTYLGRFLRDKGLADLAAAGRLLKQRAVPARLRFVGAPDPSNPASLDPAALQHWADQGLIEMRPWTDDVPAVWRDANLAVLPSYREGFGMSLAEAAATGRALIATNVRGCREAVLDGVSGLLVPPRDPTALAGAIERLAGDPGLRRRLAAGARHDAETRLSLERINAKVLVLYETMLRKRRQITGP